MQISIGSATNHITEQHRIVRKSWKDLNLSLKSYNIRTCSISCTYSFIHCVAITRSLHLVLKMMVFLIKENKQLYCQLHLDLVIFEVNTFLMPIQQLQQIYS